MTDAQARLKAACIGERCWCGAPASKKVGEEILFDDPQPERHNLTAYVCARHYAQLMGPLGAKQVGVEPRTPDAQPSSTEPCPCVDFQRYVENCPEHGFVAHRNEIAPSSTDEDGLILLMLGELHANVPEADRPLSMSDLSDEQAERARKAVRKVLVASMLSKPAGHFASMSELESHLSSTDEVERVARAERIAANYREMHGLPEPASLSEVAALERIAAMMGEFVDNWPRPKRFDTALALIAKTLREALGELSITPSSGCVFFDLNVPCGKPNAPCDVCAAIAAMVTKP